MARLEDLTVGASVTGLVGSASVSVVAAKWHGNAVLEITFKDAKGQLADQLLYREDEERLSVADGGLPWSFDADADQLRLASEAYRIHLAHLFDPYLACILRPLSRCRTRFRRSIRKCCRACPSATFSRTTPARARR